MSEFQPPEPFGHLKISSAAVLEEVRERSACSKCRKSKMYFCYNCLVPVERLENKIPYLKLPVSVEIIKHPGETNGKSTAVHAAVLAPDDVTLRTFPDVVDFNPDETVLVFPSAGAASVAEAYAEFAAGGRQIRRAVFLDCTWAQCRQLLDCGSLSSLRRCHLADYQTRFWRYQRGKPRTHLATIEAVYYFVREFLQCGAAAEAAGSGGYDGSCDDLLFFFDFFYKTVYSTRPVGTLWAYRDEKEWTRAAKRSSLASDSDSVQHRHDKDPSRAVADDLLGAVGCLYSDGVSADLESACCRGDSALESSSGENGGVHECVRDGPLVESGDAASEIASNGHVDRIRGAGIHR